MIDAKEYQRVNLFNRNVDQGLVEEVQTLRHPDNYHIPLDTEPPLYAVPPPPANSRFNVDQPNNNVIVLITSDDSDAEDFV